MVTPQEQQEEYYQKHKNLRPGGANSSTSKISTNSTQQLLMHQYKDAAEFENGTSPAPLEQEVSTARNTTNKKSSSTSASDSSSTTSSSSVPSLLPTSSTGNRRNDTEAAAIPSTVRSSCQTMEIRRFRLKTEGETPQKYLTTSISCGNDGNHFYLSDLGSREGGQIFQQNSDGTIEGLDCNGKVIEIPDGEACDSEKDIVLRQNASMDYQKWCIDELSNQFINQQCTSFALKIQQHRLKVGFSVCTFHIFSNES